MRSESLHWRVIFSGQGMKMETGRIKESHIGISSHLGAMLREWAIGQAGTGCYSWAALPSNDIDIDMVIDCGVLNEIKTAGCSRITQSQSLLVKGL